MRWLAVFVTLKHCFFTEILHCAYTHQYVTADHQVTTACSMLCTQNSFMMNVRNGDVSDQGQLSVSVSGPTSRLPVTMTWRNVNKCQCDFVPVEAGRHTVSTVYGELFVTS